MFDTHHLSHGCQNIGLTDETLERFYSFIDQLVLVLEEAFLLYYLLFDGAKQVGVSFLLRLLHQRREVVKSCQIFRRAHGNLIVFEDVLTESNLFVGFVTSADDVSVQKLVGLDVCVNVHKMKEIELKELVHGVPVLVALNLDLEELHSLGAKLTHLII